MSDDAICDRGALLEVHAYLWALTHTASARCLALYIRPCYRLCGKNLTFAHRFWNSLRSGLARMLPRRHRFL